MTTAAKKPEATNPTPIARTLDEALAHFDANPHAPLRCIAEGGPMDGSIRISYADAEAYFKTHTDKDK